ncbi:MAG: leucyl/phenylalanyl-tRNA--protein transferase [Myxococcales bacterium]|nr:leucyl/phenylalanyl-tRNA--protein transferase [Myxococcales bacterium]
MVAWLNSPRFPRVEEADENGLLALGGVLHPERLLLAYRSGIFPWSSDPVITWWSPDPRAVFPLDTFRAHSSVARSARRGNWHFTLDADFAGVMRGCAELTPRRDGTWINDDFLAAYQELHRRGSAHSVEVWEGRSLIGGLYGVTVGGFFGGESMFNRRPDASKAALAHLVAHLCVAKFTLLDAQVMSPHLERMGAIAMPRRDYLARLQAALEVPATFGVTPGAPAPPRP